MLLLYVLAVFGDLWKLCQEWSHGYRKDVQGRRSSQRSDLPLLNSTTEFLTAAYQGHCSIKVSTVYAKMSYQNKRLVTDQNSILSKPSATSAKGMSAEQVRRFITKYLYLTVLQSREICDDMVNRLYDSWAFNATLENWITSFKREVFSIQGDQRPGRPISVSTPEGIDAVHEMILSDRQTGLKHTGS